MNLVNLDAIVNDRNKSVSYIGSLEGILANGTVRRGTEIIHTEDGGFTFSRNVGRDVYYTA